VVQIIKSWKFWLHGFVSFLEAVVEGFGWWGCMSSYSSAHQDVNSFVSSVLSEVCMLLLLGGQVVTPTTLGCGLMKESVGLLSSIEPARSFSRSGGCPLLW
jgi:hypothetical protein